MNNQTIEEAIIKEFRERFVADDLPESDNPVFQHMRKEYEDSIRDVEQFIRDALAKYKTEILMNNQTTTRTIEDAIINEFNCELPSLSFEGEWYVVEKDAKAFLKQALAKYKADLLDTVEAKVIGADNPHLGNGNHVACVECDRNRFRVEQRQKLAELKGKNE